MNSVIKQIMVDYLTQVVVFDIEKITNKDTKDSLVIKRGLNKNIKLEQSLINNALCYTVKDNEINIAINLDYSKLCKISIVTSNGELNFIELKSKYEERLDNTFENVAKINVSNEFIKNNVTGTNDEWLKISILVKD